jgi:hypothetical protein
MSENLAAPTQVTYFYPNLLARGALFQRSFEQFEPKFRFGIVVDPSHRERQSVIVCPVRSHLILGYTKLLPA